MLRTASGARSDGVLGWLPTLTVDELVFWSFGASIAIVVVRALMLSTLPHFSLRAHMGPANWDISKSWASNVTVLAATLGTIIAAKGVLPDKPSHLSNATYAALDIFFAITVALAPLVFNAIRVTKDRNVRGATEPQQEGFVGLFLASAVLTVWGVVGQLLTILNLFQDIRSAGSLSDQVLILFAVLLVGAGALTVIYAWISIGAVVSHQMDRPRHRRAHRGRMHTEGFEAPENVDAPLPSWTVL